MSRETKKRHGRVVLPLNLSALLCCLDDHFPSQQEVASNRLVKLRYHETTRLVRFAEHQSLAELLTVARETFDRLQTPAAVMFEDDTKELVAVPSDLELALVLEDCASKRRMPKFVIVEQQQPAAEKFVIVEQQQQPAIPKPAAGKYQPPARSSGRVTVEQQQPAAVGKYQPPSRSSGREERKQCHYFQRGHCRNGHLCRFSHGSSSSNATSTTFASGPHIERWLITQLEQHSTDNIEYLSSAEGLQALQNVLSSPHLGLKSANMLVKLLTKEGIRCSMLKHNTNLIFGSLLGSSFLKDLQVHINTLTPPTAQKLEPFLLLAEEIQQRTLDGWKHVPLHEIKDSLDLVPECPLKGSEFRSSPIIPTTPELLNIVAPSEVPVNKTDTRYSSATEYLETHFRLTREDFIEPLRNGIKQHQNRAKGRLDVRVYENVRPIQVALVREGIATRVRFDIRGTRRRRMVDEDWKNSKRLMFEALVCFSPDNFQRSVVFGTVASRDELAQGLVDVILLDGAELQETAYTMIESTGAYFGAYCHVLKVLQKEEMECLPFNDNLIALDQEVKPPSYLVHRAGGDFYDFEATFPEIKEELGRSRFHILQEWPDWPSCTLDASQKAAIKHALTKRLALIQGPPGTGKTFVGLLIVRALLANLFSESCARPDITSPWKGRRASQEQEQPGVLHGPILIVCYTNHALDQFLEKVMEFETRVVRVGAGSKSKTVDRCTLANIRKDCKLSPPLVRMSMASASGMETFEEAIENCKRKMELQYVTRERLLEIATYEQSKALFENGPGGVKAWLEGESIQRKTVALEKKSVTLKDKKNYNRFDLLEDEDQEPADHGNVYESSSEEEAETDTGSEMEEEEEPKAESDEEGSALSARIRGWLAETFQKKCEVRDDTNPEAPIVETIAAPPDQQADRGKRKVVEVDEDQSVPAASFDAASSSNQIQEEIPLDVFVDDPDLWSLPVRERRRLHQYWLLKIHTEARRQLARHTLNYLAACKANEEAQREIQLSILRKSKVVGMTTTGAARLNEMLAVLQPEIVIVEEAAEVLESHVLACLTQHTRQLILIGDHLQLRPSVATYKLATKHKLEVSLFERMVKNGIQHVMLQTQRRMKPCISKLISGTIYPSLKDHARASEYEDIKGMKSSLFFLDHKALEQQDCGDEEDGATKINPTEAGLVVELCVYLLNQACYDAKDVTILAMYKGQVKEIQRRLAEHSFFRSGATSSSIQGATSDRPSSSSAIDGPSWRNRGSSSSSDSPSWRNRGSSSSSSSIDGPGADGSLPRVSSVDEFQGEENTIILLSLVRSNIIPDKESAGKIGFLNIANRVNVALSRARQGLYIFGNAELLTRKSDLWRKILEILQEQHSIGDALVLRCQNHPDTETPVRKIQDFRLVGDGGCNRPCEFQLECGHACPRRCHPGSHDAVICPKQCEKIREECGHSCANLCHGDRPCRPCQILVAKINPSCGHEQRIPCASKRAASTGARGRVGGANVEKSILHASKDAVGIFLAVTSARTVARSPAHLVGDHATSAASTASAPSVVESHVGRVGKDAPGDAATLKCELKCHETCQRGRCDMPCRRRLSTCRHRCIGLCGEPCPTKCRICDPETRDPISLTSLGESDRSDRFIQLQDCGHLFEVSTLDRWMESDDNQSAILLKSCPLCKTPIRITHRYANIVKAKLQEIEQVKRRVMANYKTNQGFQHLGKKNHSAAIELFTEAIQVESGLFQAHLGIGTAYCQAKDFEKAIDHLRLIVQSSPLSSEISKIRSDTSSSSSYTPLPSNVTPSDLVANAGVELAIQAMVQWALALTNLQKFAAAVAICEAVLRHDPGNESAARIKSEAEKMKRSVEIEAVELRAALGSVGGTWYKCPNGHIYVVGECGRPMEQSRCPDCAAVIGGSHHIPFQSNVAISLR
ncbi:hypothetical protein SELMODRAFT_438270 [Selaginella moellendorffii]|uniref:Uncharacterized protein n=1 Tax=Selaginella moellendorffii TaxID=88036 RepID=D8QVI4_SELML|nr:hypothetical protein SELMODRAFT_438270 [Selaginella moellendorffii]